MTQMHSNRFSTGMDAAGLPGVGQTGSRPNRRRADCGYRIDSCIRERAFTLIELLVVIAIIALLISLIMPALTGAKRQANNVGCVSNLRMIGMAANMYASDHQQFYPSAWDASTNYNFADYLQPYLPQNIANNQNIWICPGGALPTVMTSGTVQIGNFIGTYSLHNRLARYLSSPSSAIPRTRIPRQSEVILIGDGCQSWPDGRSEAAFWDPGLPGMYSETGALTTLPSKGPGPDVDNWSGDGWLRYRHNGGVNVVMVDGHVTNLKKGTVTIGNLVPDR